MPRKEWIARSLPRRAALVAGLAAAFTAGLALALWYPRAPAAADPAIPAGSALAQQIAGTSGAPLTMSPNEIPSDFKLVYIIDAQKTSDYYLTRGDTLSVGSETFLLAYEVDLFTDAAGERKIARHGDLVLNLLNLRDLEIITQIGPRLDIESPPPPRQEPPQE